MEVSSVIPCKGCTPWQGLLLTASILICWHLSTTDDFTMEPVPPHVANGDNVLLLVHNLPENLIAFAWIKGEISMNHIIAICIPNKKLSVPGRLYSGREKVYGNGSLLLQNVNEKDTGIYILQTFNRRTNTVSQTSMYLYVHKVLWKCGRLDPSATPTIESVPSRIAEGGSVLLFIHNPPENIIGFVWFKRMTANSRLVIVQYTIDKKTTVWGPAYTGRETLYSDGSLLIHGVTPKDSGWYGLQILGTYIKSEETAVKLQVHTSLPVFCNPLISSQLTIQPVPQYPTEKEQVLLQVHNLPEDLQALCWYKAPYLKIVEYNIARNSISWGPTHGRTRWMVYNNGSLMLQGITEKDAGKYILDVIKKDSVIETAYVELQVKKYVSQPFVQITDTTVAGSRSVTFTCISPDTDISIRWIFNNQNLKLTKRMTLSPTKCGLKIDPFKSEDAGEYKCEVSNRFSLETSLPVSWPR